jgi:hypothetical protein
VKFEPIDMTKLPKKYNGKFDFAWSNCVFGHLGSMDNSFQFIMNQFDYLKPGGWAIQTTEMNISSLTETIDRNSSTIIFRLKDLERLIKKVREKGHYAEALYIDLGNGLDDKIISHPPIIPISELRGSPEELRLKYPELYKSNDLKIAFGNYAITQIILIFQKSGGNNKHNLSSRIIEKGNLKRIKKYIESGGDIEDYHTKYGFEFDTVTLSPLKKKITIEVKAGFEKTVEVKWKNSSKFRFFDLSENMPLNTPPLIVGTFNPINHESKLSTDGWHSKNRPTTRFSRIYESDGKTLSKRQNRLLPGQIVEFMFNIIAPPKKGKYQESFGLIVEGVSDLGQKSEILVEINAT